jgi:hypothetical protein
MVYTDNYEGRNEVARQTQEKRKMSKQYTYEQIAENFDLWGEYVDPHATWTEEDFNEKTTEEKVEIQEEIWGKEETEQE